MLLLCLTVNAGSEAASNCSSDHRSLYDYWDKTLACKVPFKYSKYKPSVFLMVNVATYWGFTKVQYPALNALAARYNHSVCPLRVFGVPCNQFHYQEPGLGEEIPNGLKYVRPGNGFVPMFPLLEKRDVNGLNESNVYTWLKACIFLLIMCSILFMYIINSTIHYYPYIGFTIHIHIVHQPSYISIYFYVFATCLKNYIVIYSHYRIYRQYIYTLHILNLWPWNII